MSSSPALEQRPIVEGTAAAAADEDAVLDGVDLQQLQHLRTQNALWRSWSIGGGLNDAVGEESESVGRRTSAKRSPKRWELLYENFLLNVGDSILVLELTRRHRRHDGATRPDSGIPGGAPIFAGPRIISNIAGGGEGGGEGSVKGGQLFGSLERTARASSLAPAFEHLSRSPGTLRTADSGANEAQFGMEPAESETAFRTRHRVASAGSVDEAPTSYWAQDALLARVSGATLLHADDGGSERVGKISFLRKKFTQARNLKRRDVPDDSVSPFLGDELSVHYNNYFGSFFNNSNNSSSSHTTAGVDAVDGGHGSGRTGRWGSDGGGTATCSSGSGGGRGGGSGTRFDKYPFGIPSGVATSHGSYSGSMRQVHHHHHHHQQHPLSGTVAFVERKAGLPSDVEGSAVSGSPGDKDGAGLNVPAAAAAADDADAGLALSVHSLPDSTPYDWTETETARIAGGDDDDEQAPRQPQNKPALGAFSALSHQMRQHQQQQQQKKQDLEQATVTLPPSMETVQFSVRTEHEGRTDSIGAAAVNDDDAVPMAVGGEGGEKSLNDQNRPESSSSGARSKMVLDQDHEQAVMLPLPDWDNWTPDRRNWTYPAVVRAFPRWLFESDSRSYRAKNSPDEEVHAGAELRLRRTVAAAQQQQQPAHDAVNANDALVELPSPFESHSMGEAWVRTAADSDLAPAGVGAGPWRRRWLLLRQTYLFEFLQRPAAAVTKGSVVFPGAVDRDAGMRGGVLGQERRVRSAVRAEEEKEEEEEGGAFPKPVGFLCLSRGTVEEGGVLWGPRTLLLRCHARPNGLGGPRVGGAGGANAGTKGRRGGVSEVGGEIRVEIRVPSAEVADYWTKLLCARIALEVSSLFEPLPDDMPQAGGRGQDRHGSDAASAFLRDDVYIDDDDDGGDGGGGDGDDDLVHGGSGHFRGFSVVGTGRFSKVVCARRKQPWRARNRDGVCAVKIVDKHAFWSRVLVGQERADTLAREVFCQSLLTCDVDDDDDDDDDDVALQEAWSSHKRSETYVSQGNPRDGQRGEQRQQHQHQHHHQQQASVVVGERDELGRGSTLRRHGGGIVRLHSVLETADELVLEMDLMSGENLFDHVFRAGALQEPEAAGMLRNLLLAIAKCNKHGFCHRDVKLANLLYPGPISSHGVEGVRLADFGMATRAGRDGLVRGRCGTPGYVAPEILKARINEGYGLNVDIFSAGVVLYICLCSWEPFYGTNQEQLIQANKAAHFDFDSTAWEDVSEEAKDLISKMLEPDPAKRITPTDALQHSWILKHREGGDKTHTTPFLHSSGG